tara:strand:- start:38 stop:520 length:483 start_codon:yes stop_codon:yes gene_type:complete
MKVNSIVLLDEFLDDIDSHLESVSAGAFIDVNDSVNTFKNIQDRGKDMVSQKLCEFLDDKYDVSYNFVRRSPEDQDEPNFIHSDEMMGDLTCLLYLNENPPSNDGTTIYNEDESPSAVVSSKLNRMMIFKSKLKHSRNIFENFGRGDESRQVQVIFLNNK